MSKANQAFQNNEEAVSPVIGVILMVAITVVLAAVVFVLVTQLSGNQDAGAPDIGFSLNEAQDRIEVQAGVANAWDEFDVVCDSACHFDLNAAGSLAGTAAAAGTATDIAETTSVSAGNYLGFCMDADTDPVNVKIIHSESNEVVFDNTFATLTVCA